MPPISRRTCRLLSVLAITVLGFAILACREAQAAKNVILMIADGSGHNTWLATSMYQGKVGKQVYDQAGWLKLACSTYPLSTSNKPTGDLAQVPSLVYNPALAWNDTVNPSKLGKFAGYAYLKTGPTDSAAAATALATGRKTYNNAINWTNDNQPMLGQTIAEIAKKQGKSVGVITTVQWCDATPAGLGGAHNVSRANRAEIANEMLGAGCLDVIMGTGHPEFDNDGVTLAEGKKRNYADVGGQETWDALKRGERGWKLVETKADFEALTSGPTAPKVLGVPQVSATLQQERGRNRVTLPAAETKAAEPFAMPMNTTVPSLTTMTKGAINCLDKNPKGFYLMIEGGAVDHANHANQPDRMIEEQIDYLQAVEAVVAWVDAHSNWDDTLLILTADHETGLVWGPDSAETAFQPLEDRGPGKLPGLKFNATGHSKSLVPLCARGPGSQRFVALAKGKDEKAAAQWHVSGQYVDNTDVFAVMKAEVEK
jgi:alkaline phosphatase